MTDYISREEVMQKFLKRCDRYINMQTMRDMINEIPAADVQPVKRGEWIWDSNAPHREHGAYRCNKCGCHYYFAENYCYNCGAKMSEDGDENETD